MAQNYWNMNCAYCTEPIGNQMYELNVERKPIHAAHRTEKVLARAILGSGAGDRIVEFQDVPLNGIESSEEGTALVFTHADVHHPFAIVHYTLNGTSVPWGLRMDLDKRIFLQDEEVPEKVQKLADAVKDQILERITISA